MEETAVVSALSIFREVWKGTKQLVDTRNRFSVQAFASLLKRLSWRELGTLLVQLAKPINEKELQCSLESKRKSLPVIRCVTALSTTLVYMQTAFPSVANAENGLSPVHSKFVSKLVGNLTCAAESIRRGFPEEFGAISRLLFKAISLNLAANDGYVFKEGESATISAEAVVDTLVKPQSARQKSDMSGNGVAQRPVKKQRVDPASKNEKAADLDASGSADCITLITETLSDKRCIKAHGYVVQVLRARNSIITRRLLSGMQRKDQRYPDQLGLVKAIIARGHSVLTSDSMDPNEHFSNGVFALIRDVVPLVPLTNTGSSSSVSARETALVASAMLLCRGLTALFRMHTHHGSNSLYIFCSKKKHRCYQWAALCRITTWLMRRSKNMDEDVSKVVAEASRVCWVQCVDSQSPMADPSILPIWSLLTFESLNHFALRYPHSFDAAAGHGGIAAASDVKPLFLRSAWSQSQYFVAIASIICRIVQTLSTADEPQTTSTTLFRNILGICDTCLRLIPTEGASMGLFRPYRSRDLEVNGEFHPSKCTLDEFVFRPASAAYQQTPNDNVVANALTGEDKPNRPKKGPSDFDEQQREAAEEAEIEAKLVAVSLAMDTLIQKASLLDATVVSRQPNSLVITALQTTLNWIRSFAVGARSNAGKQVRQLANQQRVKVRVVGEHARPHTSATDWVRLQRLPLMRNEIDTIRDPVLRIAAFLAGMSGWHLFADCKSVLAKCVVWGNSKREDEDLLAVDVKGIANICCLLENTLSEAAFKNMSFSALQTLASMVGVPPYLSTSNMDALRLPTLQIRDHPPKSSELLIQELSRSGLLSMLLEPEIVVKYIDWVHSDKMLAEPLLIRAVQVWLDMIGSLLMHSLFRSHLCFFPGNIPSAKIALESHDDSKRLSSELPLKLNFAHWWSLALSACTRCLIGMSKSSQTEPRRIRLVTIFLSYLASWCLYLQSDTRILKSLSTLQVLYKFDDMDSTGGSSSTSAYFHRLLSWLSSFSHPSSPPSKSIVSIVYFLACRLPLCLKIFDVYTPEMEKGLLGVSRDIWGIATESMQFLVRIAQHPALRQSFLGLDAADDYIGVVKAWLTQEQLPKLVSQLVDIGNKPVSYSSHFAEEEADLIAIPEFEDEDQSNEDENDVVGRILHESALGGNIHRLQQPVAEYYTKEMQWKLWCEYNDAVLRLPSNIILYQRPSGEASGSQSTSHAVSKRVDVAQLLVDENGLLYKLFFQLSSDRGVLARSDKVYSAIAASIPIDSILATLQNTVDKPVLVTMCVSAALILPEISQLGSSDCAGSIISVVTDTLVSGLVGEDSERCARALYTMAWRQKGTVQRHVKQLAANLSKRVAASFASMRVHAHRLRALGIAIEGGALAISDQQALSKAGDLVLLTASDDAEGGSQSIAASFRALVDMSPVFEVMLTGEFSEAKADRDGTHRISLQCSHKPLLGLLTMLHMLVLATDNVDPDVQKTRPSLAQASLHLERNFTLDEIADIFELAALYAVEPAVLFLAWHFACKTSALQMGSSTTYSGIAASLAYHLGALQFHEAEATTSSQRSAAALVLLCLDDIDVVRAARENIPVLLQCARFLLS